MGPYDFIKDTPFDLNKDGKIDAVEYDIIFGGLCSEEDANVENMDMEIEDEQ
ncbi:hypothetical protein [Butyrivibrio sp. MB2005]|uniref:hypothetical protein n=1 Tax=Butyrivibrio sp. MB2005 TaxID=1280678 RepID=UPI0004060DEC|nr:hypothetical protein [Butyrivibrio sp. MB2005]